MRAAVVALLLNVVAIGQVAAQEPPRPGREGLLEELGRGRLVRHSETGQLRFAGGSARRPSASSARLGRPSNPREAARAYVERYGELFGIGRGARGAVIERSVAAGGGRTFVRLQQVEGDVPVLAGQLTLQVDAAGNVISALGEASPRSAIDIEAALAPARAQQIAIASSARAHDIEPAPLSASAPRLAIYDPALLGPSNLPAARLVWQIDVEGRQPFVYDYVLVDAQNGVVALRFSQIGHAQNRRVCDAAEADAHFPCLSPVLTESGGTSSVADVNDAFAFSEDVYDFFMNRFTRDSLDGAGMAMTSTVRFCEWGDCSPNAFWYADQAYFAPGMASDDVVAHELVHGFTDYSSGLFYWYQSGAINEGISDIFGEFVDLTNGSGTDTADSRWLMGEDSVVGAIRDMQEPALFNQPDRVTSDRYWGSSSDNGGVHYNSGIPNKAAYLMVDGDTFNGQTISGIGIDKTAAIWYRVATFYLASGSDFADLGLALNQACADLVGSAVKDGSGASAGGISSGDCAEVAEAVLATEMAQQPTVAGAAAPEAPICGGTYTEIFFDQIAEGAPGWSIGGDPGVWFYDEFNAASKPWSLWGATPAQAVDARARRVSAVTLPANTFLHFRHAHLLDFDSFDDSNYDGGRLEYELNDSGTWHDAQALFTHNGYNGSVTSEATHAWAGKKAFVADSRGYTSSRVDFTSLAGEAVRFRFRILTNADDYYNYGWFIDDVRLYTCTTGDADTTPPTVSEPNANLRAGVAVGGGSKPVKLNVTFTAEDSSGIALTELQKRTNSNSYSSVTLSSATATSANQKFPTSKTTKRQFRARATDNASNRSAWSTADAFRVLAHQNGSSAVSQSGSWKSVSKSSFYGGSVRYSSAAGASQSRTATVSDFAIVSTLGPSRGRADVYVDGVYKATLDLYSSTVQYRRVVYSIDFGAPGTHTIELRVTGTKNAASSGKRVDFDAFLALAP